MQTKNSLIAGIILLAVLVGAFGTYTYLSVSKPGTISGGSAGGGGNVTLATSCPANSQAGTLTWVASNYSPASQQVTYVATPSNITSTANNNNKTVVSATKLTSAGIAYTSSECNQIYTSIVGDNLNWYQNRTTIKAIPGINQQVIAQTFQYSAGTSLVSNAPQTVGTSNAVVNGIGTGGLVTSIYESIQGGRGWLGYPNEGLLVAYSYNNLAVASISLPNAQTYGGGQIPIAYVLGQDAQTDYVLPSTHFSLYTYPGAPNGGGPYTLFSPQIQMQTGFSGTTQVSFVGQTMLPLGNFAGANGQWYTGQATYTTTGLNGQSTGTAILPATSAPYFLQLTHS